MWSGTARRSIRRSPKPPDDPQQEGLQALSLLAAHVRIVATEAGVDPATVAGDAATLAGRMDELSPEALSNVESEESNDG